MYAPGPGWAPGGAATGQEWGYIRELRFSSRFLNDVTLGSDELKSDHPFSFSAEGRVPVVLDEAVDIPVSVRSSVTPGAG